MNMPSNIAAVSLALRSLLKAALPPDTEVTTLPPAQAEQFNPQPRARGRLNVALYRMAASPHRQNAGFVRLGEHMPEKPLLPPLDLRYLITAYGPPGAADKHSAERLLETALCAIIDNPVFSSSQLEAALPGETPAETNRRATVSLEDLPQADLLNLFVNLRAEWRPVLTLVVRFSEK